MVEVALGFEWVVLQRGRSSMFLWGSGRRGGGCGGRRVR